MIGEGERRHAIAGCGSGQFGGGGQPFEQRIMRMDVQVNEHENSLCRKFLRNLMISVLMIVQNF